MISLRSYEQPSSVLDIERYVDLTQAMGQDFFKHRLLDYINHFIPLQHINALDVSLESPTMLLGSTRHQNAKIIWQCWQIYNKQFYEHDIFYNRLKYLTLDKQHYLIGHLVAEDIKFRPYRDVIYHHYGISERLSCLYWHNEQKPILFNLYRHKGDPAFSQQELKILGYLLPTLICSLQGHFLLINNGHESRLRSKLLSHANSLTDQELAVCCRVLRGMTYIGIASDLQLKESTVKTYRNRAFDKLGIHFKSQLFALLQG